MEKCFDQAGWDSRFLSLKVAAEDLSSAVDGMRALNFCGVVIAGPYQTEVVPLWSISTITGSHGQIPKFP